MENTFSEKDLVSFGIYLLSLEREERILDRIDNAELANDALLMVHDADIANWKELQKEETTG